MAPYLVPKVINHFPVILPFCVSLQHNLGDRRPANITCNPDSVISILDRVLQDQWLCRDARVRVLIRVSFSFQQVYDDFSGVFLVNRICLLRMEGLFKESLKLEEQWIITLMVRARGFGIENKNIVVKTIEVIRLVLRSKPSF